ncbi:putative nuclear pore protein [Xylariaceae sp. FL0804]|nr:putative nuclear pore protein [Xylariaceae sp. FL0804]
MAHPTASAPTEGSAAFDIVQHGHKDHVQAIAFNAYGDRCATGGVDGKIRVFNRLQNGIWRLCDSWGAHQAEVLELQWLPPTVYPNLLASLGIEGRFKLWAEDPSAAPGRRFSARGGDGKAVSDMRSSGHPYRSFSIKHDEVTRSTYFALLAADGHLTVFESEEPETVSDAAKLDDFQALPRPGRGEEACLRVRFDPNPEPCYAALRAGVPQDALGLVASGLQTVRVFRTRDTVASSFGAATRARQFYLAVEVAPAEYPHRQLVRDVAWAPANYRGYDVLATACQDGLVRVFRIDTPFDERTDGKSWAPADVLGSSGGGRAADSAGGSGSGSGTGAAAGTAAAGGSRRYSHAQSGIRAEIDKSGTHGERNQTDQPGQVRHLVTEVSKLDAHRGPVWRVGFDDDGQILGSVGDDGKLMCYRRLANGTWAKSSELGMMKTRLTGPGG